MAALFFFPTASQDRPGSVGSVPALHTMALDDAMQNLLERDSRAWDVGLSTLERSIIIDALYQSIDNAYRTYGRRVNERRIGAIEALIVKLLGREAAQ